MTLRTSACARPSCADSVLTIYSGLYSRQAVSAEYPRSRGVNSPCPCRDRFFTSIVGETLLR